MLTFKIGQIFCDLYNEKNNSNLTPKQVFCEVIAPLLYDNVARQLTIWHNSKFTYQRKAYVNFEKGTKKKNGELVKPKEFSVVLKDFCEEIEENGNIMDTRKIFNGCACAVKKKPLPTTEFCYCDNIYLDKEQRYNTWVGSVFGVQVNGGQVFISDKNFIWHIFEGIKKYKQFLDNNPLIKDKQLPTWNGVYLYEKFIGNREISDSEFLNQKDGCFNSITLIDLIYTLSICAHDVKQFEMINFDDTNTNYGIILCDLSGFEDKFELYEKMFIETENDFSYKAFKDLLGNAKINNIIYNSGYFSDDIIDPQAVLIDAYDNMLKLNKAKKTKTLIKYFEYMNKNYLPLIKEFVGLLTNVNKEYKNSLKNDFETLFKCYSLDTFVTAVDNIIEKTGANEFYNKIIETVCEFDAKQFKSFILLIKHYYINEK